jgi:bifunctional non-homologous end joining protein LigD
LRQPSLKAIRLDKDVRDLRDADTGATTVATAKTVARSGRAASTRAHEATARASTHTPVPAQENTMRLSHPERVVFPDAGYTKQDVADYYAAVADRLLPGLVDRPTSIVRCPDGIGGACFFQKHQRAGLESVGHVRLKQEDGTLADYLVVRDRDDLMTLVQFNALEFHPWGAKDRTHGRADRIVFDLDPGPGVAWGEVKRAARQVRDLLAQLELVSFLRTTGGKGLHVVVPLNPGCAWPLVRRFAQGFAHALAESEPERYVATATKSLRDGRIFIDYLRNGRGATSVASYSLRARPGAPVAMPLAWSELARLRSGDAFDLRSAPRRLARMKQDPWDGIDAIEQDLSRWSETATRAPASARKKKTPQRASSPAKRAPKTRGATSAARTRPTRPTARKGK